MHGQGTYLHAAGPKASRPTSAAVDVTSFFKFELSSLGKGDSRQYSSCISLNKRRLTMQSQQPQCLAYSGPNILTVHDQLTLCLMRHKKSNTSQSTRSTTWRGLSRHSLCGSQGKTLNPHLASIIRHFVFAFGATEESAFEFRNHIPDSYRALGQSPNQEADRLAWRQKCGTCLRSILQY